MIDFTIKYYEGLPPVDDETRSDWGDGFIGQGICYDVETGELYRYYCGTEDSLQEGYEVIDENHRLYSFFYALDGGLNPKFGSLRHAELRKHNGRAYFPLS